MAWSVDELRGASAVLIMPPFAGIDRPSLGLHVLQACARAEGLDVKVAYANIAFAKMIGVDLYEAICFAPTADLLGERIFSPAAFGESAQYSPAASSFRSVSLNDPLSKFGVSLEHLQGLANLFLDEFVASLLQTDVEIFGCTTTFEQTCAAVSLLSKIKLSRSYATTMIGGANCDGPMADGIAKLAPCIDVVFSGESEATFPKLLKNLVAGVVSPERVVVGTPCKEMDALPTPDFKEYYAQMESIRDFGMFEPNAFGWLPYESSRGCWWGEKHHCTFCGINGTGMVFRQKSPSKVVSELRHLLQYHPNKKVLFVDNIMPSNYFDDLLPELELENDSRHMFYEQKANLTLDKLMRLSKAGVKVIQPGIESLSTSLLKLMRKGVSAGQNIALLRYALVADVAVNWNLLQDFPGDIESNYLETMEIIPSLLHLNPPTGLCNLSIDRFSPYFNDPKSFEIENVRPMPAYADVFPQGVDASSVAYHFVGDYSSAIRRVSKISSDLDHMVDDWRDRWTSVEGLRPLLEIGELGDGLFIMVDSRKRDGGLKISFISFDQVTLALSVQRPEAWSAEEVTWAVSEAKVSLLMDGLLIPLATAEKDVMERFDRLKLSGPIAAFKAPERRTWESATTN